MGSQRNGMQQLFSMQVSSKYVSSLPKLLFCTIQRSIRVIKNLPFNKASWGETFKLSANCMTVMLRSFDYFCGGRLLSAIQIQSFVLPLQTKQIATKLAHIMRHQPILGCHGHSEGNDQAMIFRCLWRCFWDGSQLFSTQRCNVRSEILLSQLEVP